MKVTEQTKCTVFELQLAKLEWMYQQVQLYKQLKHDLELAPEQERLAAQWKMLEQFLLLEKEIHLFKY